MIDSQKLLQQIMRYVKNGCLVNLPVNADRCDIGLVFCFFVHNRRPFHYALILWYHVPSPDVSLGSRFLVMQD